MLRRSRVGSTPDTARLSAAVSRPGIDPRVWCSLAVATGESFVDADHGVFVEVKLLPSGEEYNCRVSSEYAGVGFGFYSKIHKDDELVVLIPMGDPAEGCLVVARLWSASDTPPSELSDTGENEVVLVVEKDKTLRLITSGEGKVFIKSEDTVTLECDKVRLGEEEADEKLIIGSTYRDKQKTLDNGLISDLTAAAAQLTSASTALTTAGAALTAAGPLVLLPPAGVSISAAGAAVTTAAAAVGGAASQITSAVAKIQTFETDGAANQDYLSNVSNTKK